MALSERQHSILAEMGIPVWERRAVAADTTTPASPLISEDSPSPDVAASMQLSAQCVVVVPSLPLSESEQSLLTAMLKTIALSLNQVDLLDATTFNGLSDDALEHKALWFIGSSVTETQHFSVQSDSLTDLLAEPKRKANAWQALKQLARFMK